MKLVAMHEAKAKLTEYVAVSQKDRVIITSHGKPVAVMVGVQGEDLEDLLTRTNPEFWEMIARVRGEVTIPLGAAQPNFDAADAFEAKHGRPMTGAEAKKQLAKGRLGRAPTRKRLKSTK